MFFILGCPRGIWCFLINWLEKFFPSLIATRKLSPKIEAVVMEENLTHLSNSVSSGGLIFFGFGFADPILVMKSKKLSLFFSSISPRCLVLLYFFFFNISRLLPPQFLFFFQTLQLLLHSCSWVLFFCCFPFLLSMKNKSITSFKNEKQQLDWNTRAALWLSRGSQISVLGIRKDPHLALCFLFLLRILPSSFLSLTTKLYKSKKYKVDESPPLNNVINRTPTSK